MPAGGRLVCSATAAEGAPAGQVLRRPSVDWAAVLPVLPAPRQVFVPATGIPFGGTRVKIWRAAVEGRGGALTQVVGLTARCGEHRRRQRCVACNPLLCPPVHFSGSLNVVAAALQDAKAGHITHVVVGDKGVSSLPLQLRPPPTPPPPPQPQPQPPQPQQQQRQAGSSAGPAGPAAFVSPEWLEQSLAQGQPLPAAGFPPPEEPEVLTPVAGGGWVGGWVGGSQWVPDAHLRT